MYKLSNSDTILRLSDGAWIPADSRNTDYQAYLSWLSEGNVPEPVAVPEPPPPPTLEQTITFYDKQLDSYLDSKAKELTFSGGRINLIARAGYPNKWQTLAVAFGTWMDTCNDLAWQMLAKVIAGEIEIPTFEEVVATFPEFVDPTAPETPVIPEVPVEENP